jgi:MFS transporter, DHA2 family, multidrug resistance protein
VTSSTQTQTAVGLNAPLASGPAADPRTWIAVVAGIVGAFMAILDIGITNSSLNVILGTLSATQEEGSWISTSYLVAEIIVIPLTGFFCRVFGLRTYMIGTTAMFLLSSILCGLAWNLPSMIVFRTMQGFAGGALIPMALTIIMLKLAPSKRSVGMAALGLTATVAPALGPTFGGYLSETYGWPSIFYINCAPGLLLIAGVFYGLDRERVQLKRLINADWLGISCMALGLGSLTIFLEEGNLKGWFESSFIIVFAALAIFGLLGWFITSALREDPFVNLRLYGRRNFLVATVLSAVIGMGLYGTSFMMPLYLGQIAGYTPMQIGKVLMWAALPQLPIMPFAAVLASRIDNRILCSLGLALFGISCLMNAGMDATTGYDQLVASQIVRAVGTPFLILTLQNFAMNGIAQRDVTSASSLYNMTRNLGGSIGIALLATTLTNREHFHSARLGESISSYSAATLLRLDQLTQWFVSQGTDPTTASNQALQTVGNVVRREAYVMAYNDGFWIAGVILLSCVVVIWLADMTLGGEAGTH